MYDVIVLGSGPAGYTAALYTSRAFLKTLILTGQEVGGQLTTTTDVENYPGFAHGIQGPQLVEDMKKQAERFGAEIKVDTVIKVEFSALPFKIHTADAVYEAKSVIIATGASAKYLGLPSEERLRGKGVSACATCDGFFFRDKDVVVIGGGDTAMEEATFLTRFASRVTIIHRREEFRASPIMLERAKKDPKIAFLTNKEVVEFVGESALAGVKLRDVVTGEETEIATQGAFLAIGHKPSTDFLGDAVLRDEKGYIAVSEGKGPLEPKTQTSVPGVFVAGDCADPRYRQAIVAAGQGCMAGMDAEKWLAEKG